MKLVIFCATIVIIYSAFVCPITAETFSPGMKDSIYDVSDFGAVGDGVKDDSEAIQGAIDTAFKTGGGSVLLPWPKVRYRLARDITVKSNIFFRGVAAGVPVFLDNATLTTAGDTTIVVENLSFEGKGRTNACLRASASTSPREANTLIKTNRFKGCKFGIYSAHWIRNVVVEDNSFTDCDYGLYLHTVDNWKIINNRFEKPIVRPIEIHNGHYNLVSGNYIEGDKSQTIIGILFMTNADLPTDGPSNNIVSNNIVKHVAEEGIMMEETVANAFKAGGAATAGTPATLTKAGAGWKANEFAGREVLLVAGKGAGQWGKIVSNTQDSLVVDHDWTVQPDGTTMFTVVKAIKGNIISGNIVEDTGRMGIELYGPSVDNVIDGNVVRWGGTDRGYSGIAVVGTSGQGGNKAARHPAIGNLVSNNSISGAENAGVQVYQVNYIQPDFDNFNNTVVGNKISYVQTGVLVQRSRHTLVNSNSISFVATGIKEENDSDDSLVTGNLIHDYKTADMVLSGQRSLKR